MSIILGIATFLLMLVALFLILIVLAQKAKSDGGMGSALGGGMAEAAFGADTGNVLTTSTIRALIAFFVLTFLLYLGRIYERNHAGRSSTDALPAIAAPATPAPAPAPVAPITTTPAPTVPGATATPPAETPKAP